MADERADDAAVRAAYDRLPYQGSSHHQTHPQTLAALAALRGLDPALPTNCRVLEIGCAEGGNLIPMAAELPESRFVGVDLSSHQIGLARQRADLLGLDNLAFHTMSLVDIGDDFGEFDYVIAHGVFSWVSDEVRSRLLEVTASRLAPHGVAYISFNTFPGWLGRRMVRDLVRFHAGEITDPAERSQRAIDLVNLLVDIGGATEDAHTLFLRATRDNLTEYAQRPSYIEHEYFAADNRPFYFRDVVDHARRHGLDFLDESSRDRLRPEMMAPAIEERVSVFAKGRIEQEQLLDFVTNCSFRRTLFCRAGTAISTVPQPEALIGLYAATAIQRVPESPGDEDRLSFQTLDGRAFSSTHPVAKVVLAELAAAWPRSLAVRQLLDAAPGPGSSSERLDFVVSSFYSGVLDLTSGPVRAACEPGTRPLAHRLAREQAAHGSLVTNLHHRSIKIDDPFVLRLVTLADGSLDRRQLVERLARDLADGHLESVPEAGDHWTQDRLAVAVDRQLQTMVSFGLLMDDPRAPGGTLVP